MASLVSLFNSSSSLHAFLCIRGPVVVSSIHVPYAGQSSFAPVDTSFLKDMHNFAQIYTVKCFPSVYEACTLFFIYVQVRSDIILSIPTAIPVFITYFHTG